MDTNNKNKWIEDVLNSAVGSERAKPSDALFEILEQRINIPVTKGRVISLNMVSTAAACILMLISINLYMAQKQRDISDVPNDRVMNIVQYYDITNDKEIGGI